MARNDLVKALLVLGAVVAIIEGIVHVLPPWGTGEAAIIGIVKAIVCIVLGVILLGSVGAIKTKHKISVGHWLIMIILGIVIYYLGGVFGGILIIIAGIVALILSL